MVRPKCEQEVAAYKLERSKHINRDPALGKRFGFAHQQHKAEQQLYALCTIACRIMVFFSGLSSSTHLWTLVVTSCLSACCVCLQRVPARMTQQSSAKASAITALQAACWCASGAQQQQLHSSGSSGSSSYLISSKQLEAAAV
jgi:hypothetical protein